MLDRDNFDPGADNDRPDDFNDREEKERRDREESARIKREREELCAQIQASGDGMPEANHEAVWMVLRKAQLREMVFSREVRVRAIGAAVAAAALFLALRMAWDMLNAGGSRII